MWRQAVSIIVAATGLLAMPSVLNAAVDQKIVLSGSCRYADRVMDHRADTVLVLCDTATIDRNGATVALDFGQRGWGSMARFTGSMTGDALAVSQVWLRHGGSAGAGGTCKIFHHGDGRISTISCLAQVGSRWIAANFVPSSL
ncbi:MAG: hypothetical protein ACTHMG_07895 [Sphingomonas sp.]